MADLAPLSTTSYTASTYADPSLGDAWLAPPEPPGMQGQESVCIVQPGETLTEIAARYQLPVSQLVARNEELRHSPDVLRVGQVLVVPIGEGAGTPPEQATLAPGQTLAQLAGDRGVPHAALQKANRHEFLDGEPPGAGDAVWVPQQRTTPAIAWPRPTPPEGSEPEAPEPETPEEAPVAANPAPAAEEPPTPEPDSTPASTPDAAPAAAPAPFRLRVGTAAYAQSAGQTERGLLVLDAPLTRSGRQTLRVSLFGDRSQTWDGKTQTGMVRSYAYLQSDWVRHNGWKLGTVGGVGVELRENPALSDRPLGYAGGNEVYYAEAKLGYTITPDVDVSLKASGYLLRIDAPHADTVNVIDGALAPEVTVKSGLVSVSLGLMGETDQRLGLSDESFLGATATATYRTTYVDVSLNVLHNIAGHYVFPNVSATAVPGGAKHDTKVSLSLSHPFELRLGRP